MYVGGGSTANLLAVWRLHGLDRALADGVRRGRVLAGVSAGMNCWFEASMTDSFLLDTSRPLADGLGFLTGSACPHYDGEPSRRPSYLEAVGAGFPAGVAGRTGSPCSTRTASWPTSSPPSPARAPTGSPWWTAVVEEPLEARLLG